MLFGRCWMVSLWLDGWMVGVDGWMVEKLETWKLEVFKTRAQKK